MLKATIFFRSGRQQVVLVNDAHRPLLSTVSSEGMLYLAGVGEPEHYINMINVEQIDVEGTNEDHT